MHRVVAALVFLMLVDDQTTFYANYMFAPFAWLHPFLTGNSPLKVHGFDLAIAMICAYTYSRTSPARRTVKQMRQALQVMLGTTAAFLVFGVLRGGDARAALWQVYLIFAAILFAFTVSAVFTTFDRLMVLVKVVMLAAIYRAIMCFLFWFFYIQPAYWEKYPIYFTTHDDTVLWVLCIVMLLVNMLLKITKKSGLWGATCLPLFVLAVQLNGRRLAWVSLAAALMVIFALVKAGPMKRRITRTLVYAVPIVALYVGAGWGSTAAVFKPLKALETISTKEDDSTKARNVENLGLLATAKEAGPIMGTGYGHPYKELSNKYSVAAFFEMWPFIPHNSILGLLAYTGIIGFSGFWLAFPTAMYLLARMARLSASPQDRAVGLVGAAALVICANQMFGDMGLVSLTGMYFLATMYALALRMPIPAGAWPAPAASPGAATPAVSLVAEGAARQEVRQWQS